MAGPYRCTNLVILITRGIETPIPVGVVEGFDIDLGYEGGAEPIYGSRIRRHSAGSKTATFSLTRWFYADTGEEDLLLDLLESEEEFTLTGELVDNEGHQVPNQKTITLTGCRLYRWRPRTGGADDIIGEEASGQATDWSFEETPITTP